MSQEKYTPQERIKVIGTGKFIEIPKGKELEMHPLTAKELANKGFVKIVK